MRTTLNILIKWKGVIVMVKQCQSGFSHHEKAVEIRKLKAIATVVMSKYVHKLRKSH